MAVASSSTAERSEVRIASEALPDAPGLDAPGLGTPSDVTGRTISGTVMDPRGAEVLGAQVTLSNSEPKSERKLTTDGNGFFSFVDVGAGRYQLAITSAGFATWISGDIVLRAGESYYVPHIALQIAVATTNVDVTLSRYDIAEEQVKVQEKQRVLGVFPNFYVSYVWDAVPLTAGQKFRLALREEVDPEVFAGAAVGAGLQMWLGYYRGYGNGAKGFFTRMGASYGDGFNSSLIANAILPSLLHQDPRYFYKGTGTIRSRALYAMSAVFLCKGDNGRWQPNYSNVFGNLAAAGISNAYYPAADRGATLTVVNTSIGFASSAAGNVIQEFFLKKITHGAPQP